MPYKVPVTLIDAEYKEVSSISFTFPITTEIDRLIREGKFIERVGAPRSLRQSEQSEPACPADTDQTQRPAP